MRGVGEPSRYWGFSHSHIFQPRWREVSNPHTYPKTWSKSSYIIPHITLAGATKCFNGKYVAFLHLRLIRVLDEWHLLVSMNTILFDIMAGDVPDCFHRKCLAVDLDLITLHDLLYGRTNVADPCVNPGILESSQEPIPDRFLELSLTLTPVFVAALTASRRLS